MSKALSIAIDLAVEISDREKNPIGISSPDWSCIFMTFEELEKIYLFVKEK